ncbi:MAG: aspartate-semialdehyde dehydrogenase [Bdellovibrionales bacterium]|nr:aspartate-semialdehyde dehydrogenase [Bdellovibrionales bacterium]
MKDYKLGVVGATGVVGEEFLDLMEQRRFHFSELRLFASDRSVGQIRTLFGKSISVQALNKNCFDGLDLVFFSSGDDISKEWAPQAVRSGAYAVDNSAAFRMDPNTPLIVPEVNGDLLKTNQGPCLIANPNCSTIQLVMVLAPLQKSFGLNQVRVATYQAVSGAGKAGTEELQEQLNLHKSSQSNSVQAKVFPQPIAFNCIPQIGSFSEDGFCSEERKIRLESRKILNIPQLQISAWTVRIPALNSHSEAAWITLKKEVSRGEFVNALKSLPGITLVESLDQYATALQASKTDPVYVSRIHQDLDDPKTWLLWIVSDNLRKGAALNGIQIAEKILS